jgi:tyrosinase
VGNANISAIKGAINKLYGSSVGSSGLSKRATQDRETPVISEGEVEKVANEVVRGQYRQYLANILMQKFALNGSYAIYVFMGDFDDTPSAWATSPSLVGTHAVFGAMGMTSGVQSKMMQSKPGIQVTGSMPLTSMLLTKARAGEITDMAPATVEKYLTDNLHWRVGMFDGTQIPAEDVADLTVTVVTAQVKPAVSADEFPTWSNFVKLTHITQGKPGGC